MKKIKQSVSIGDVPALLTSDHDDGEFLDTEVKINAGVLCWVSGEQRQDFINELNDIIEKYRI